MVLSVMLDVSPKNLLVVLVERELVNLLVDLTFSEDETKERINSIQQRATSSTTVDDELLSFIQKNIFILVH